MRKDESTLNDYVSKLKDERLIEILNIEYNDYTEETLNIVLEELCKRGYSQISIHKEEPQTLRDLILQVKFDDVKYILKKEFHIAQDIMNKYNDAFIQLLATPAHYTEDIQIIVDRPYDKSTNTPLTWDVFGIEAETSERFAVDLFSWNNWMSFNVNPHNVSQVGKELYVACCLFRMTAYGFSLEEVNNNVDYLTAMPEEVNHNIIAAEIPEGEVFEVHPWLRFWGRTIDIILFTLVLDYALIFTSIYFWQVMIGIDRMVPTSLFLWVLVEPVLLSTWGTTPGKFLLGMAVREIDGSKLSYSRALNRSASVWFFGMGCGISIVNLIMNIASYRKLTQEGATRWDKSGKYNISHNETNMLKLSIAIMILLGVPLLRYFDII